MAPHDVLSACPPRLPPTATTPEPVNVSAVWDAGLEKARIGLVPNGDPKVVQYQLRTSPDHPHDVETERVVATIPVPETEFLTDDGLTTSSAPAFWRARLRLPRPVGEVARLRSCRHAFLPQAACRPGPQSPATTTPAFWRTWLSGSRFGVRRWRCVVVSA